MPKKEIPDDPIPGQMPWMAGFFEGEGTIFVRARRTRASAYRGKHTTDSAKAEQDRLQVEMKELSWMLTID